MHTRWELAILSFFFLHCSENPRPPLRERKYLARWYCGVPTRRLRKSSLCHQKYPPSLFGGKELAPGTTKGKTEVLNQFPTLNSLHLPLLEYSLRQRAVCMYMCKAYIQYIWFASSLTYPRLGSDKFLLSGSFLLCAALIDETQGSPHCNNSCVNNYYYGLLE